MMITSNIEDLPLSKNYMLSEFLKSEWADKLDIDNTPTESAVKNLQALVTNVLQPLRDMIKIPVDISSGYRCPALNKAVGGEATSFHLSGKAADIKVSGMNLRKVFDLIRQSLKYDKVIYEQDGGVYWIHVQWNEGNNRQIALIAKPKIGGGMNYYRV
jgi:zinc D-Ala-D-Ala carboxypeptidase